MPLPLFIPAAIFLGSVLFGGKKAYDAWDANSKAKVRNKEAEDLINQAKYEASFARERLRTRLETLGRKRFMIQKGLFSSFYRTFAKIRNFDKRDLKLTDEPLIQPFDIDEVKVATLAFEKVAGGLVGGLTAGAALAYGTYGAVGLLASASTGTAIGTLSGAAATNATLAWLGGGTLATGGGGVAAGTLVLGGLVAAPALALFGVIVNAQAQKALEQAKGNLAQARKTKAETDTVVAKLAGVTRQAERYITLTDQVAKFFRPQLEGLVELVRTRGTDYRTYTAEEQNLVVATVSTYQMLRVLVEVNILAEKGLCVTQKSKKVLTMVKQWLGAAA